jgi:hypothetical protein
MRKRTTGSAVLIVTLLALTAWVAPTEGTQLMTHMKLSFSSTSLEQPSLAQRTRNGSIVWDNYYYSWPDSDGLFSQLDQSWPLNAQVADDFLLNGTYKITEVHWWGWFGYKTCGDERLDPNPCDFNIIFYSDDGTGNTPTGNGMYDPTPTALAVYLMPDCYGTPVGPWGDSYEYDVILPTAFNAAANVKYWIAIQAKVAIFPQWFWWTNGHNPDQLHGNVQGCLYLGCPFWTDTGYGDMAFSLFGYPSPLKPDLDCTGSLTWSDVKPKATVTGSFQVMNIGEPASLLNWTIASHPNWGNWAFSPTSGTGLTPKDGAVTVNVTVTAPQQKEQGFQGEVTVVNTNNASDSCTIPVSLTTPLNTGIIFGGFFERLIERFPHVFQLLRLLLGMNEKLRMFYD